MWLKYSNSIDNEEIVLLKEEEEETISLCDLPNYNNEDNQTRKEFPLGNVTTQNEFDFYSCSGGSFLKNSTMCTPDEVFFQGQILPNIGVRSRATYKEANLTEHSSLQIRTKSMEHCHDSIGIINSSITNSLCSPYEPQIRNQLHSQPSPTPQIRFSKNTHTNIKSYNRKSTMWSLFRVGLVTTEISLQDLKTRRNKNSNTSNNSHQRKRAFLGSCKCAVETIPPKIVTINRGSTNCKKAAQTGAQSIVLVGSKKELHQF